MQVDYYWPHIAPYLAKACARTQNTTSPAWLYQQCQNGNSSLLLGVENDKVILTAVITFQTRGGENVANICAMGGGNLKLWEEHFPDLAKWCAMHGAGAITYTGPKAYARLFPKGEAISMNYKVEIER